MTPSQQLVDFIKKQEGFSSEAYKPLPTDRWTMGYGFTYINDIPVREGDSIDVETADILLEDNLKLLAQRIGIIPDAVTQQQFDAVISLAYNIGLNSFKHSDTGTRFYDGEDISDKFPLWNMSGGHVVTGLINRRARERAIYTDGYYAS